MAGRPKISQEEKEKIIDLYKSGKSMRELEHELHHDRKWMSKILKDANIPIRDSSITSRRYHYDKTFFEKIDTEEKAYWLGMMYADGFIVAPFKGHQIQQFGMTLKADDKEHLEKFCKSLNSNNPVRIYKGSGYNPDGEYARIIFSGQKIVDDLKDKGVIEQKTLQLSFPGENIVPKKLRHHFVRGYFDGDGSLNKWIRHGKRKTGYNYQMSFTGMQDFLKGVLKFFNKENIVIRPHNQAFEFNIGGNRQLKKLLAMMYDGATIYLDRKYDIYQEYLKYGESRGIIE